MNRDVIRQILNIIALVGMLVVNSLSEALPLNGADQCRDRQPAAYSVCPSQLCIQHMGHHLYSVARLRHLSGAPITTGQSNAAKNWVLVRCIMCGQRPMAGSFSITISLR